MHILKKVKVAGRCAGHMSASLASTETGQTMRFKGKGITHPKVALNKTQKRKRHAETHRNTHTQARHTET